MANMQNLGAGLLAFTLLLAGCDTEDELLKQRIAVLEAEESAIKALQTQLKTPGDFEGPGVVSMFLSKDLLNSILAAGDGVVVPVPGVAGASLTITTLRTDFRLGFPLVNVNAVAKKEGLDATLSLVGAARLETAVEPGTPARLTLRVHVDSLVPRAQWGIFDFGIGGFVRDLAQVKLNEQARKAGTITIPVETDLAFTMPAKSTPVTVSGAPSALTTPELSVKGKVAVTRILPLPDGLHVYGRVSTGGAI